MKKDQIIRALRDPEFRTSLSNEQKADLTGFGEFDMTDETLSSVTGGCGFTLCNTCGQTTPLWSCVGPNEGCP